MTTDDPPKDLTGGKAGSSNVEESRKEWRSLTGMKMTLNAYKILSRRYLGGREWLSDPGLREFFQTCRQIYLGGRWSEADLDALAILHMLHNLQECAVSEEEKTSMADFWIKLPVRDELKRESMRKTAIDFRVQN
jgi:hypothetical protein